MLNGKRTYITETKATVPQSTETQVTGKLTNNGSYYSVRGKYDDIIIVIRNMVFLRTITQVKILQLRQPLFVFVTI